jgi:serine phosphatase RsbU (regulator of sigma subunit)
MSVASRRAEADDTLAADGAAEPGAAPDASSGAGDPPPDRPPRRVARSSMVVLVVGLLVTALISLGAYSVRESNENRLLDQRVREVSTLLTASIPNVSTPLASAALVAENTGGDRAAFTDAISSQVGTGKPFVTASLWRVGSSVPLVVVPAGTTPELASESPSKIGSVLQRALVGDKLAVENLLDAPDRRLGYALGAPIGTKHYVVYAEAALPRDRRSQLDKNSAFSDLEYALFIGSKPTTDSLLASSTGGAELHGRTSSQVVPFGDSALLITMKPTKELGGSLLARLPLLLALVGTLLSFAAFLLVERINRNQHQAEDLADQNARLFAQQRSVAQTLQQSLLADLPPADRRLETAARYIAGVEGIDIGGDWYDVVPVDGDHVLIAVGDVSGRGLHAATTMASLRFAMRAYAVQGASPGEILADLGKLLNVGRDGHFATALCACIDLRDGSCIIANAGHPLPLLMGGGTGDDPRFVDVPTGPPIGVLHGVLYHEIDTTLPRGATVLLYTDGLVERRHEVLDDGLERLRVAARASFASVDELLERIVGAVIPDGADDDAALLGVRWQA